MAKVKPLSEQTLMNNYVFYKVMREPKRIKPLLEFILHRKIKRISLVESEKTLKERFAAKGARLDLYVEDEDGIVYDVEVQTTDNDDLSLRMRYYQGMLDQTFFPTGADYNEMRKSFVIFICNYDPFKEGRYVYTFQNRCDQNHKLLFGDDAVKVVVNTKGTKGRISQQLKEVIMYLDHEEVTGSFSRELDKAVKALKESEEGRQEFMMLMAFGAEQKAAGKYMGKVEQIRGWYNDDSTIPATEAAKILRVTDAQFERVLSLIKENPELDDDDIAAQVNWRK